MPPEFPKWQDPPVHEAAKRLPTMTAEELKELAADIKANGLEQPIVLWRDNREEAKGAKGPFPVYLLDGRNRLAALKLLGITDPREAKPGHNRDLTVQTVDAIQETMALGKGGATASSWREWVDPVAYVLSANVRRRHLTREQRDEAITELHERGLSTREIAQATGVAKSTVARVTKEQVPQMGQVTGKDGKSYPAKRPVQARNTGQSEWYSPASLVEAARRVMGGIDLDPASCEVANQVVQASRYYTAQDDGLDRTNAWKGRVWMNPPYAKPACGQFCDRLAREHATGNVEQACVLVNNATETDWFQGLAHWATALCIHKTRVKFWHPDRKSGNALQGQAILYLGENAEAFQREFAEFGQVTLLSPEPGEGEDIGDCPGCGAGGKYGHMPGCQAEAAEVAPKPVRAAEPAPKQPDESDSPEWEALEGHLADLAGAIAGVRYGDHPQENRGETYASADALVVLALTALRRVAKPKGKGVTIPDLAGAIATSLAPQGRVADLQEAMTIVITEWVKEAAA